MDELVIGGQPILPGESRTVRLEVARTYDFNEVYIPVRVIRGKEDGPRLFVSAAIHGDEINGVATIKKLLHHPAIKKGFKGTLIAAPIVNVFGFNHQSRYLPDRRDLNRNFPGNPNGSLASRMASIFINEVVKKSTHGIDLHTGAMHRYNLPQVRACLDDLETKRLAKQFGVPVIVNSDLRDGSLREAARKLGIPMLLFEGGQALRFDDEVIRVAVRGILATMTLIGMISKQYAIKKKIPSTIAKTSFWVRAPHSGIVDKPIRLGATVKEGDLLGVVSDPFGDNKVRVKAPADGVVIGRNNLPLVNRGNALFHIATFDNVARVEENLSLFDDFYDPPESSN